MASNERHKARLQRDALLGAATLAFAEQGWERTSVQQIASAAGVSKAKVFYYFDNKEELYAQVLARVLDPLLEPLGASSSATSAEAFWTSLQAGLAFAAEFSRSDPHVAALVRDLYQRGGDSPPLGRLLERVRSGVCRWLEQGRSLGAVRTDLPVPVLAELLVGGLVQVDRWLGRQADPVETAEPLLPQGGLARLLRDALQQRTPAEVTVSLDYAREDVPRDTDAYLDVSGTDPQPVTLRDARQQPVPPSFDREGFELIAAPTPFLQLPDDRVARGAYERIEEEVKAHTGAVYARVFDHTVRHTERVPGQRPPIRVVHADYGATAGTRRLHELLRGPEAERVGALRVVVANLWQSVAGVVHSTPLAFADIGSVADADFIPVTVHYADRQGEIGYYRFSPHHRWSWFPFLRPGEALLFKTFDGQPGERHWSCPHAAFSAPNSPEEQAGRRTSIEFRILLAFEPGPEEGA